jgi:hypothetical protein
VLERDSASKYQWLGPWRPKYLRLARMKVRKDETNLRLNHSRPLSAQYSNGLENIDDAFVLHPLEDDAEGDEDPGSANTRATMDGDGPVLAELLLRLVDLADEVDEAIDGLGYALLRPVNELKLADGAARAVTGVRHLKLPQNVLGHVVLGDGVDDEALVADRAVRGPVLVALLAAHLLKLRQHDDDRRVVLPEHAPEVIRRVVQRACNITSLF